MQPPASRFAADVGVEPQPQHITEHAIVFHWNNSPKLTIESGLYRFYGRGGTCRFGSERKFEGTTYFRIDASLYSVDEICSQTLHLPESDPRYYVLAHHNGRDEFLTVLLGRHAEQSTGWSEREAHQVRIILFQQDRENRCRPGAQRVTHQR